MTPGRARWLWWLLPIAFLLLLYREGLQSWFLADDFAWLGLIRQVTDFHSLLVQLFAPAAQGTIRPWSERGFFLLFENLFGMDALPFRIMAFATMAANLTLIAWITRRLTNSGLAGCVAAICWTANAALATVMTWSSAYNEALCPFFLLSEMALFLLFAETGRKGLWWWQLVVFSLGFGALEINVVYPAIAASYVLFVAPPEKRRKLLLSLAPLFVISVVYFAIHRYFAPLPATGSYALHFDSRIFATLGMYLKWALLPVDWQAFGHSARSGKLLIGIEELGILALFIAEFRRRRWTALFFLSWFLAALAPVLALPDHHSDYYLTIPLIGLAMLAGYGISTAARELGRWRALAFVPVVAYLAAGIPVARSATHWWFEKSLAVKTLVLGVEAAHEAHPGKVILLDGITSDLYNNALGHSPFYPLNIDDVYLTPGSELKIQSAPDLTNLPDLVLDPAALQHAISGDKLVLYSVAGDHLRNVTERYERSAPNQLIERLPRRADVGNPLYSWLLSREWLSPESGHRWMPGQASVHLGGPELSGSKLRLEGYCPEEQLRTSPRHLTVTVDGLKLGESQINDPESSFIRLFDLPDSLIGRNSVEIGIRVTPVERKDGQEYGLVFGTLAIEK